LLTRARTLRTPTTSSTAARALGIAAAAAMSSPWRSSISESEGPLPARDLFPDIEWTAKLAVAPVRDAR
jgi:hypothetical protein